MSRPRLLDLFCGAGGAAVGYHRAGFDVVGVDIKPQPHYPFQFFQADVLATRYFPWGPFDAVHASPPCQAYTTGGRAAKDGRHPDLLPTVRDLLEGYALPYVIENVPGAPMRADLVLCGSMFGLEVRRHRWFEVNWPVSPLTQPCDHSRAVAGVYGNAHGKAGAWPGMLPSDLSTWSRAMGIDWMTTAELALAIPPAFAEHVGAQLFEYVTLSAAGRAVEER